MIAAEAKTGVLATDGALDPVKDYVIETTGLYYYSSRGAELRARVGSRIAELGLDGYEPYLALLRSGSAGDRELDRLVESLTIGETYFFRHPELFESLRQTVFPELIEKNQAQRRLRIWSAGSSIGAEAYSAAIVLRGHFGPRLRDWEISILGTDINREFLARAAKGQFEEWALRTIPADERREYFDRCGDRWTIKPCFRQGVSFQYHNLVSHPFPSLVHNLFACDLILCRNVLIYFAPGVIQSTIERFSQCLVDDGWLLVGHAEHNSDWFRAFRTLVRNGTVLYQKAAADRADFDATDPQQRQDLLSFRTASARPPGPPPALPQPRATKAHRRARSATKRRAERRDGVLADLREVCALADQGDLPTARAVCQQYLAAHRLHPVPHFYLGLILEQLGEREAAEKNLRRAIYLDRRYLLAHYHLGLFFQKQGNATQAARCFRNAAALLSRRPKGDQVPGADGLTVADLEKLTGAHLAALEPS